MKAIVSYANKNAIVLFAYAVFLVSCNGCSTSRHTEAHHLQVSPEQSNSGEIIYLYDSSKTIKPDSNLTVKFGESSGTVVGTDTAGQIAVMVPNLNQGQYKISVLKNKDTVGFSTLKIGAPPAQLLVLSINDNHEIKVMKSMPYNGDYQSGFTSASSQLSFDLTDDANNVIYSASIPDPVTEGMEVFRGKDTMSREKMGMMGNATFAVKIPNIQQATKVNFYTSAPGADLHNAEGRRSRKLVSQIDLRNIQK
jgi:hypothetical protein